MIPERNAQIKQPVALALALGLFLSSGSFPLLAQEEGATGTLTGMVLDPSGEPAEGFRLVFQSEDAAVEFISGPSDATGKYSLPLPAGSNYLLVAAVAPDGARLDVPQLPPISVEEGVRRVDVRFSYPQTPEGVPTERAERSRIRELPWWRIGGAAAAVTIFAVTVFDDDDEVRASPSMP
jgi:hypothetical protein